MPHKDLKKRKAYLKRYNKKRNRNPTEAEVARRQEYNRRYYEKTREVQIARRKERRSTEPGLRERLNKKSRAWARANPERKRELTKAWKRRVRQEVIRHYGGCCACCGETMPDFLTMDHINNDGAAHREEVGSGFGIYHWIRKNNYPVGVVQVLCWNCNCGKRVCGGVCPHKRSES